MRDRWSLGSNTPTSQRTRQRPGHAKRSNRSQISPLIRIFPFRVLSPLLLKHFLRSVNVGFFEPPFRCTRRVVQSNRNFRSGPLAFVPYACLDPDKTNLPAEHASQRSATSADYKVSDVRLVRFDAIAGHWPQRLMETDSQTLQFDLTPLFSITRFIPPFKVRTAIP